MKNAICSKTFYDNFYGNSVFPSGLHMCCFSSNPSICFKTEKDFILTGLKKNHKLICIINEQTKTKILHFLEQLIKAENICVKDEHVNFFSFEEAYTKDGIFSYATVQAFWDQQLEKARQEGYVAIQAIINMDWTSTIFSHLDDIIQYEAILSENLEKNPKLMVLCFYDPTLLSPGFLNKAIESHPFCKYENEIYANTYFISPQEYLSPKKEEKLFAQRLSEILKKKKTEGKLVKMYQQINKLDEFNHMLVHDLKEPLRQANIFKGILLLEHKPHIPKAAQELLEKMTNALQEANRRIEGLRKLSSSSQLVEKTHIDVQNLIVKLTQNYKEKLDKIGGKILHEPTPNLQVMMNETYFAEIFENIIENSIKYRRKNTPLIIIIKNKLHSPRYADIIIKDNGLGFNSQQNMEVFHPFRRLHSSLEQEGSGMGLTICQRIMQEFNGEIFAEGKEEEGTTITLRFPMVEVQQRPS